MVTETLQTNTAHWELISECTRDGSSWPKRSGVYGWLISSPTSQDLSTWLQGQGRRASRLEDLAAAQTHSSPGRHLGSGCQAHSTWVQWSVDSSLGENGAEKGVWDSGVNVAAKAHVPRGFPNYTLPGTCGPSRNVSWMKEQLHNLAAFFYDEKSGDCLAKDGWFFLAKVREELFSALRAILSLSQLFCSATVLRNFLQNLVYKKNAVNWIWSVGLYFLWASRWLRGKRLPWWFSGKESACQRRRPKRYGFDSQVRKRPWRRELQPTPVFLPGKPHGQRSLAGYSPWECKELDMP